MLERLLLLAATLAIPSALRMAFVVAPTEGKMGVVQRIFYFHVPSAEMAFLGVGLSALCSALYLFGRQRLVDVMAEAAAELGCLFCTIVLVTGPIWARPIWGVWWTGEVRLTSTLVLWLILVGTLLLRQSAADREQAARWGAIAAIVGALDMPIIYKSVEWWRGLHPRVLKISGGGGLDPVMGRALLVSSLAFLLLFAVLFVARVRLGLLEEEAESLARALDRRAAAGGVT
ncbi:MAG TPA: cytochrome c biogenesis protein CcsA [Dongiaceae bacterium]|nr:cytochrome c biogenesis protein CcsA [Dongiaceae bacterium]